MTPPLSNPSSTPRCTACQCVWREREEGREREKEREREGGERRERERGKWRGGERELVREKERKNQRRMEGKGEELFAILEHVGREGCLLV